MALEDGSSTDRDLGQWAQTVLQNINEGEVGQRGEVWFGGQLALVVLVLAAPYIPLAPFTSAAGFLLFATGAAVALSAAYALGDSLSPWTKPVALNELRTDGIFGLCRHPIYTGLTLICAGLGLASLSAERLLVSALLFAFLTQKAASEETQLEVLHGDAYSAWAARVPPFFPAWSELEAGIDGGIDGVLRRAGLLKKDD